VAVYGLFWMAAPAFSELAGDRSATPVVRLLTLVVLIDGLTTVRSAALMRTFRQDKLIVANVGGLIANAAIAITLAAAGAGPFSFAYGQVAGAFVTGVLVFAFARVPVRFGLDRAIAAKLLRFGIPLAASLAVEAVIMNVQFMIIGNTVHAVALGYFLLAFNVASWAQGILGTAVRYVSVAGFSRLSEHNDEALSAGVQRSMPLLVTVVAPIVALTAVLATPLISFLYGGQWTPAAVALEFLAVFTLVRLATGLAMDALMGAGATRAALWVQLGWAVALVPALWVGTHLDGIRGAAIAHAAVGLVVAVPLTAVALRRAGVDLAPVRRALVRPVLAAVLAGGVAVVAARFAGPHPFVQLLAGGVAGLAAYVPAAVPWDQLRQWFAALRRSELANAVE
jgi:PST family polysaccharide transporter